MIVIGMDIHKRSHTLAVVDGLSGAQLDIREIPATRAGHEQALRHAHAFQTDVVWAIEDCRQLSVQLEADLLTAGERVIRVPTSRMGESRKAQREPGKSDPIDALAIARAVVNDGPDKFAPAFVDETAMDIRLLCEHRQDLVAERTRIINRLRTNLLAIDPELEARVPLRGMDQPVWQNKVRRRLAVLTPSTRVRIARQQINRIAELSREARDLEAQLDQLTKRHNPALRAEVGCGPLVAAILIGQTAGAQTFATDAKFARYAGAAPIPASSGKIQRHRVNPGGNRQVNRALYIIAMVRARLDPETRAYLEKKRAEKKTTKEALRCLKRHLARRIWQLLFGSQRPRRTIPVTSLNSAPCLT